MWLGHEIILWNVACHGDHGGLNDPFVFFLKWTFQEMSSWQDRTSRKPLGPSLRPFLQQMFVVEAVRSVIAFSLGVSDASPVVWPGGQGDRESPLKPSGSPSFQLTLVQRNFKGNVFHIEECIPECHNITWVSFFSREAYKGMKNLVLALYYSKYLNNIKCFGWTNLKYEIQTSNNFIIYSLHGYWSLHSG